MGLKTTYSGVREVFYEFLLSYLCIKVGKIAKGSGLLAFLRLELAFIGKSEPNDNYILPP